MNQPAVRASIVIINYNGLEFLDELFSTLECQTLPHFEVLVIDNGSEDGSLEFLTKRAPSARILAQNRNLGFSKAGNLGVAAAQGEFVAFLNTDMKLAPTWLEELLRQIQSGPDIAAVASKILLYKYPTVLNGVGGGMNYLGYTWDRGMFETDEGQYDAPSEVIFASAGSALFRRSVFLKSGGFDERFFMYHEDVDLSWRLWLQGHRIMTAPKAVAFHHFGGTTKQAQGMDWRELMGERNNIRALWKNYEFKNALRATARLLSLRQSAARKRGQISNLLWNIRVLPETLRLRKSIQRTRVRRDRDLDRLILQSPAVPVDSSRFQELR